MRIAQVAPLYESVPPVLYGGTERVVAWLTDALVDMGHQVTLFASGGAGRTVAAKSAAPALSRPVKSSRIAVHLRSPLRLPWPRLLVTGRVGFRQVRGQRLAAA